MVNKRGSLLAQIEADVLDQNVPVASLLQRCIVLGGRAGSEKMRDWARQELNGYPGDQPLPPYRCIHTGLVTRLTNWGGFNGKNQRLRPSMFPQQIRDMFDEMDIDIEVANLGGAIAELEALARKNEDEYPLLPPWGNDMIDMLQQHFVDANTRVQTVYWPVSDATLHGLLVGVRTALAELVAELIAATPPTQDVPDKEVADQAVQFLITGKRATINFTRQDAGHGGTNVAVAPSAGSPVTTVSGVGTAIGSQTASGAGSSVVGSQQINGSHHSVAGRDGAAADAASEEGWWTRLRKRGWLVALTTIVGGIAGAASLVVALAAWLGWTPWWR